MEIAGNSAELLQRLDDAAPRLDPEGTDALIGVLKIDDSYFSGELLNLQKELESRFEQSGEGDALRLSLARVIYCRFYAARRLKDYSVMKQLAKQMRAFVADERFAAFFIMIGEAAALDAVSEREFGQVVLQAEAAVAHNPEVAGSHNFLAESLVNWSLVATSQAKRRDRLRQAADAIHVAQRLKPDYAKFVALEARISALQGDFPTAKQRIGTAIEMESPSQPDYTIRLGDFAAIRSEIGFLEQNAILLERQEEAIAEMNSVRSDLVQLLGVLAAVIAFLVTGVSLAQQLDLPIRDFARILVMLAGLNITVLTSFSLGVGRRRDVMIIAGLVLGLLLLLGPLYYFPLVA